MALPITAPEDYVGFFDISTNRFSKADLLNYITQFEERHLRQLLNDLIASEIVAQAPLEQKYTDLIDGITYVNIDGDTRINAGLKNVLLRFVYYDFVSDNFDNTIANNVKNKNENAERVSGEKNAQITYKRYNDGINIYQSDVFLFIQNYAKVVQDATASLDNGGGSYTIDIPSTLYLEVGDIVTIGGDTFTVTEKVADVSFTGDITGGATGLDFTNAEVIYEPFEDVDKSNLRRSWL